MSPLPELLARMAAGEQEALGQLYDRTSKLINGLLIRMLADPHDAEEVLLDVYMRAWKNAANYTSDRGSVEGWLVVMARSIAIDRLRHNKALPRLADFESEARDGVASPEKQAVEAQSGRHVRAMLQELPDDQRTLLDLAFFHGFSHSELATHTGLPIGTVKSRIRAALSRLREALGEDEI
jgi:RNA polymerase sigma-70 factor (ECF subfamily)